VQVRVNALIADYAGTNGYMHINALRTLMREGTTVSGAFLRADPAHMDELYAELKGRPRVAAVTVKEAMVQSFEDTIAENQRQLQSFNIIFAVVIAFGVVYNTARVALSERGRELATLRVIGMTRGEIAGILFGEWTVVTLLAQPLGMLIGYGLAALVVRAFDTEVYRLPLIIAPRTYLLAMTTVVAAAFVSGLIVRRRLNRLDLIGVLKTRE
jgi:putative ABC transport system permease protein